MKTNSIKQGKIIERNFYLIPKFNRTLQEEFIAFGNYTNDIDKFNEILTEWLIEYNSIRSYKTLENKTPLEVVESLVGLSIK